MFITRYYGKAWGPHAGFDYHLSNQLVGIIGPNGSGKSNLISGLKYLSTGETEQNLETYVNDKAKSATIGYEFTHAGQTGKLEVEVGHKTSMVLTLGEEKLTKVKDIRARMASLFDVSSKAVSNAVFITQGDTTNMLFGDQADREKAMMKLCGVDHITANEQIIQGKINHLSTNLTDLQGVLALTESQLRTAQDDLEAATALLDKAACPTKVRTDLACLLQDAKALDQSRGMLADAEAYFTQMDNEYDTACAERTLKSASAFRDLCVTYNLEATDSLPELFDCVEHLKNCKTLSAAVEAKRKQVVELRTRQNELALKLRDRKDSAELLRVIDAESARLSKVNHMVALIAALDESKAGMKRLEARRSNALAACNAEMEKQAGMYGFKPLPITDSITLELASMFVRSRLDNLSAGIASTAASKANMDKYLAALQRLKSSPCKSDPDRKVPCPNCGLHLHEDVLGELDDLDSMIKSNAALATQLVDLRAEERDMLNLQSMVLGGLNDLKHLDKDIADLTASMQEQSTLIQERKAEGQEYSAAEVARLETALSGLRTELSELLRTESELEFTKQGLAKVEAELQVQESDLGEAVGSLESGYNAYLSIDAARLAADVTVLEKRLNDLNQAVSTAMLSRKYAAEQVEQLKSTMQRAGAALVTVTNRWLADCAEVKEFKWAMRRNNIEWQPVRSQDDLMRTAPDLITIADGMIAYHNEQRGRVESARVNMENAKKAYLEVSERMKRDEGLRTLVSELRMLKELVSRKGIPMQYAMSKFAQIAVVTSDILEIMDAPFAVRISETTPFAFEYVDTGMGSDTWKSMDKLSGGQRMRLSIAFVLAAQQVLLPKVGFLVLDEPSTHLDAASVQDLANVLERATQFLGSESQIWIVDHHEVLQKAFDDVVLLKPNVPDNLPDMEVVQENAKKRKKNKHEQQ